MTTKQKQWLLLYLGYPLEADGILGPETGKMLQSFQKEYGSDDLVQAVGKGWHRPKQNYWQEIRYFKRNEPFIGCSCGKCGGFPAEPEEKLIKLADRIREHFGVPVIPTSTVRCKAHNAAVGGVRNSRHLLGKAMDFKVQGLPSSEILDYVKHQQEVRYAYAVSSRVVHMDIE